MNEISVAINENGRLYYTEQFVKKLSQQSIEKDKEIDRLNNIITGYNLILRDISNECYEKKMETGDAGYYDIMEKIDKLIGE